MPTGNHHLRDCKEKNGEIGTVQIGNNLCVIIKDVFICSAFVCVCVQPHSTALH